MNSCGNTPASSAVWRPLARSWLTKASKTPLASSKSPRLVLRYMMDRDSAEYRAICQTFPALPSLLLSSQYSPTTNGEVSFAMRSEEHTSELQSLMRNSYAVFCLKKKQKIITYNNSRSKRKRTMRNNSNNINYQVI